MNNSSYSSLQETLNIDSIAYIQNVFGGSVDMFFRLHLRSSKLLSFLQCLATCEVSHLLGWLTCVHSCSFVFNDLSIPYIWKLTRTL